MISCEVLTNISDIVSFLFCTPEMVARLHPEKIESRIWFITKQTFKYIWGDKTPPLSRLIGSVIGTGLVLLFFIFGARDFVRPILIHDFSDFRLPIFASMMITIIGIFVFFVGYIILAIFKIFEEMLTLYSMKRWMFTFGAVMFLFSRVYALITAPW